MDRRETLKSLFLAPLAGSVIATTACSSLGSNTRSQISWASLPTEYSYGRTDAEKLRDQQLFAETYFREHELLTLAVLCDIILPNDHPNGGALDAGLPDFVEFMVKDRTRYKIPVRGGIAWLDSYSIEKHGADFLNISENQRLDVCDDIAYPDNNSPNLQNGIRFFSLMRDLTLTGYYTTERGLKELGYLGNTPNVWDGVPTEVLQRHGKSYDQEWLSKCVDQTTRDVVAEWDEDMNLLS
jgi:hypothetical protein